MEMAKKGVSAQELCEACTGAVGEVLTEDNRILFVGRVELYDPQRNEMWIGLHRGRETPRGVLHQTPVKVQIHVKNRWGGPGDGVRQRIYLRSRILDHYNTQRRLLCGVPPGLPSKNPPGGPHPLG